MEQRDNSGVLFKNEQDKKKIIQTIKGTLCVNGQAYLAVSMD
jgi:hypothetical protein